MPDDVISGPAEKPARARGNALQRTALDLDRLSRVEDRDIAAARRDWKRRVKDRDKGLIDASPESEEQS